MRLPTVNYIHDPHTCRSPGRRRPGLGVFPERRRAAFHAAGPDPFDHAESSGSHDQTRRNQRPDAGDLISAKLTIVPNDACLTGVKKVGIAPLEKAAADAPAASSGFELLKPGE